MSVVALGAVRSCGVTTLALALAATWPPGRRVLLAELDPAGGTLAAASGWPPEPGLVSLAAGARRASDPELVWEHCHRLPGGVAVLAGPASPDQARTALGMLTGLLGRLGELDADVLVDCGRLSPGSIGLAVLESAEKVVFVTRPRLSDLHALAAWGEARSLEGKRAGLVTVGDGPYPDDEITQALGVEVLARLPWDPGAAGALTSLPASAREVRVSPLVRAARSLADRLAGDMVGAARVGDPPVGLSGGSSSVPLQTRTLRSRVLRAWRPEPAAGSTNGTTPEEVSQ